MNPVAQAPAPNPLPQVGLGIPNGIPPAPNAPAYPVVNGQPNPMPQARQIQDDWQRSVAQLNAEILDLRTMMEELLREIRDLIQEYDMHTQLNQLMGAVETTVSDTGNLIRSIDQVLERMRAVDTSTWAPAASQRFSNQINRLVNWVAQLRQQGGQFAPQAQNPHAQGPQQLVAPPMNQGLGNMPFVPGQPAPQPLQAAQPAVVQPAPQPLQAAQPAVVQPAPQPLQAAQPAVVQPAPQPLQAAQPAVVQPVPQLLQAAQPAVAQPAPQPLQAAQPAVVQPAPQPLQAAQPAIAQPAIAQPVPQPPQAAQPAVVQPAPQPLQAAQPAVVRAVSQQGGGPLGRPAAVAIGVNDDDDRNDTDSTLESSEDRN